MQREVVIATSLTAAEAFKGSHSLLLHLVEDPRDEALRVLTHKMSSDDNLNQKLASYTHSKYRCFIALRDGMPIGHIWWVDARGVREHGHPQLVRLGVQLEDKDTYLFDFVILPEYRGGGNATEFLKKVQDELRRRGYERALGFVAPKNKQARWFYGLQGWRDVKTVTAYRLLALVLVSDAGIFVKNGSRSSPHQFDFRLVFPRPGRIAK